MLPVLSVTIKDRTFRALYLHPIAISGRPLGLDRKSVVGFCKETIEKLTKNWPGGSYLVLRSKPMVPGGRPLIATGYK